MSVAAAQEELEQHLDSMIAGGADLDDILAALRAQGALTEAGQPTDDDGRPVVAVESTSDRHYFNIRDRAKGDPVVARDYAEWALRKLAGAHRAQDEANEAAARHLEMVERYRSTKVNEAKRDQAFCEGLLDQYMEDFYPGEKRVDLIGGKLKLVKNRATISWDEPTAKAWAMQQEGRVDDYCPRGFSKSAVKDDLKKLPDGSYALSATGEIVEFVRDVPPAMRETFKVEF